MTAVASPPSVQSGPRLAWYNTAEETQDAADEITRFLPRKTPNYRSSSLGSTSSTATTTPQDSHAAQKPEKRPLIKKKPRNPWPNSKSEPVAEVANARLQAVPAFTSGSSAASTMSAIHQPSIVPSQHMLQSSQQNGTRQTNGQSSDAPTAILALVPMNGTFEKKQINVPFVPEVLRIGRQTNAKTQPTPINGFFDSKVLSRQHAEIWADKSGKIWIRDVKSSNGTFVNGHRLSPENRESDPHELRENDTLELGIDIVAEDQNSIVHHKVSAKVEHAGPIGNTPNILDLNFGDLDPASGGGLLPSPLTQQFSHQRGRSSSNLSNRSIQSNASTQISALQQQRQMNYWNSPLSVEQVVKRLTGELKLAKQQSQDLSQTDEFLTAIMKPGYAEKEKAMKPSPLENNLSRQLNGRPKVPRVDSFSRFSEPPAPPPQQPLPEKPDAHPRSASDSFSSSKRIEADKSKSVSLNSPVSRESSQILSLIEALTNAKREIDTQGARVKELEELLLLERTARESAEEKVKNMEVPSTLIGEVEISQDDETALKDKLEAKQEDVILEGAGKPNGSIMPLEATASDIDRSESSPEVDTNNIQLRLENMMEEMEAMRTELASFKKRAETAEDEHAMTQKSLSEMIATLRRQREEQASAKVSDLISKSQGHDMTNNLGENGATEHNKMGGSSGRLLDVRATTQWQRRPFLDEASPYASMFGVVLLGVGLMAYLNGWQKMDK
ncbi:hypothetical protein N7495_008484 [Penicillium taxi]|uniref:uncharacterized protein n=1 Tax=Penicillium taxi TaxID=168475 RepID=UPI0025450EF5|nr:uncharacterized protein N7495_008484 [Penicillium taxi]KAJ5888443.1 hypothetical protein N7495_008484 [Penicillium taxi]